MKIPDVNVLLYARDQSARHHQPARAWTERNLSGLESVGFATVTLLGFIRIATNPRIFEHPLTAHEAIDQVKQWLAAAPAIWVHPTATHLDTLDSLLAGSGTAGNLTTDAHLAALAIEHNATLASFDGDFHRFESLDFEYLH